MTTAPSPARCPVPHGASSEQKTSRETRDQPRGVQVDAAGVYHVRGFEATREVLRSEHVAQAGFMAEAAQDQSFLKNAPVLFLEGEVHHDMRRQTARYFTPATVQGYRRMMERLADNLIHELVRRGQARLDDLSLRMAVQVAARVVGLTDSLLPGLGGRVAGFVQNGGENGGEQRSQSRSQQLASHARLLAFYLLDVKPAIHSRRRKRREDVISHLLDKGYSDLEILTECLTYGTAGMVTTREFITVAAWHLLERPDLRQAYLHGTEAERHALLHEILRLEPVVSQLLRRATRDISVSGSVIPAGSLIALHVPAANTDPEVVGEQPDRLCPQRALPRGVQAPVMSFGDGHHRCPGAYVAIQEADIFLRRLLWLRDLQVVTPPLLGWNETVKGYELRGFTLAVTAGGQAATLHT